MKIFSKRNEYDKPSKPNKASLLITKIKVLFMCEIGKVLSGNHEKINRNRPVDEIIFNGLEI